MTIKTCKWMDSCRCNPKGPSTKTDSCERCQWYFFIDSGFGYCKAIPEPIVVAWCKDVCSFYKRIAVKEKKQ